MAICTKCGERLWPGATNCGKCGTPASQAPTVSGNDAAMKQAQADGGKSFDETVNAFKNRETITKKASAEYTYKLSSGDGQGGYAKVVLEVAPLPCGEGYKFINAIFSGAIPKNFIPGVEQGVQEGIEHGILAGYPVVDIEVKLVDGKYHPVDSSLLAFKQAALNAFHEAMRQADPKLIAQ